MAFRSAYPCAKGLSGIGEYKQGHKEGKKQAGKRQHYRVADQREWAFHLGDRILLPVVTCWDRGPSYTLGYQTRADTFGPRTLATGLRSCTLCPARRPDANPPWHPDG
ncbi:hypothetical protein AAFF_G00375060 [Aldrovandia affinis]|uniref:Uncharacterized protein n=1 Tax=Aldrovandia affinis TaxID=143900 RepID=A0AAD7WMA5_9TELE|nr:hypothetical protein AAFF_G00375060 [Aldrovandia affinis]